jgi:hypothetical protein
MCNRVTTTAQAIGVGEVLDSFAWLPTFLEHDPEKWKPVFGQDHAQTNNLDRDPIQSNWIMV